MCSSPSSPPEDLKSCRRGAEWALAAATAQELGLFRELSDGAAPAIELAEALSLSRRGVEALLGVLVDLGLARREPGEAEGEGEESPAIYALTGLGRARFVDRDTPDHEAPAVRQWLVNIRRWATELPEAVRRGEPPGDRGRAGAAWEDREALARFMDAMDAKERTLVRRVAEETLGRLEGERPSPRVLDLGGGPGTFSREFLRRGARVVLADRPEVVDHVAGAYRLAELPDLELWGGDFLEELPEGPFDAVLVANITHIYDAATNSTLLHRVADRLRPGGVVAILDFVRGPSAFASLFAITMLLNTERGGTYARSDYEEWLREAGYRGSRLVSLDPDRQLLTAVRPGP